MRIEIEVIGSLLVAPETSAVLQIEPLNRESYQRLVSSSMLLSPAPTKPLCGFTDLYGNSCLRGALPEGPVSLTYRATVEYDRPNRPDADAEVATVDLPAEAHHYLQPSRYCQSDRLAGFAADRFGLDGSSADQAAAICRWVHRNIGYAYGVSDAQTSAIDTLIDSRGVCRDFAHVCIALCRALSIPARYVSGYCLGLKPPDFHAWFEAYLAGRWTALDATVPADSPREALVAVAVGRDAADCAWSTLYGSAQSQSLSVAVTRGI